MIALDWIALVAVVGVLGYLFVALLRGDRIR